MLQHSAAGSLFLLLLVLVVNACGTSTPTREGPSLHLRAVDSRTTAPLDSIRVWNRQTGDTLELDSTGQFALYNTSPALYIFDIDSYGYHRHRHVSAVMEPGKGSKVVDVSMLPQRLSLDCESAQALYRQDLTYALGQDSSGVQLQIISVLAQNGRVEIQPVVVNDLMVPVFVPENFGAMGHYSVLLYDENGNRIAYKYENTPPDRGQQIYSEEDIMTVVPNEAERLSKSTLILQEEVDEGTSLYAQMEYNFSLSDTLKTTSVTGFPPLSLGSLQDPLYDTLRVTSEVQAADSLVAKRDTTVMEIVGIDTTVTRDGYLLYSTLRDRNAASTAEAARSLLYVPDSVKAQARHDSLEAERPVVDIDSIPSNIQIPLPTDPILRPPYHVVDRSNTERLDSLLTNDRLASALSEGLPNHEVTTDSLLSFSETLQTAYLSTPELPTVPVRRGLNTEPDTALSPTSTATERDTTRTPGPSLSSFFTTPPLESSPTTLPSTPNSVPLDSLRLTVSPSADSVLVDTVTAAYLSDPPDYTYWHIDDAFTVGNAQVMVVDSSFRHLRARPYIDTTATPRLTDLVPDRLGQRDAPVLHRFPQQLLAAPTGGYRSRYLNRWKEIQERDLQQHYCEIFPASLDTQWHPASMH